MTLVCIGWSKRNMQEGQKSDYETLVVARYDGFPGPKIRVFG